MKVSRVLVVSSLSFLFLTSCGNGSNSSQDPTPKPTPTVDQAAIDAKRIIRLKALAYIDFNCMPKYSIWKDPDPIPGVNTNFKQMDVYNQDLLGSDAYGPDQEDKYIFSSDYSDSTFGNLAVRTAYLASLYHSNLSFLYSYVYDIHAAELKSLRKEYSRFRSLADKSGRKVCPVARNLSDVKVLEPSDIAKIQGVYDELAANWQGFKEWYEAAKNLEEQVSNDIDASVRDAMTPKCSEYPTADGKYTVVKCTVPPG